MAKVSSKLLAYYWRYANMDRLVVNAATWMGCTGNCFMRVIWDPTAGPELNLTPEEVATLPPQMQKIAKQGINLGDLQFDVVTPFEIDPDPDAQYIEEASHLIHTKARSPIYLEQRYGDLAKELAPDANASDNIGRYYTRRIQSLIGPSGAGPTKNEDEESVAVLTHSLWIRPSKKNPRGIHAVIAGDRVLQKGEFQPGLDDIPYVHLLEIPVPGRFWGTCSLEQCLPLQADYNRARSQLVEVRNLMSKPKWMVPKGSGISDSALTSEPGELVFHTPGLVPTPVVPPPMPADIYKGMEYTLKDMEDNSAQHEVTQARAPSGVRSGVAIAQLQEQDEQMLAPSFLAFEKALSKLGSTALKLLANNASEDRIVKVVGKNNEVESLTFKGSSIIGKNQTPGANYFDVECQMGSQLPLSKEQRMNYIVNLINARILDPVADKKKIMQLLDLGTEEPLMGDDQLQRQNARRENIQMMQMTAMQTMPWDDDALHWEEHNRFEIQPEFQQNALPEVIQIIEQHKQEHVMKLAMVPMQGGNQAPGMEAQGQPPQQAPGEGLELEPQEPQSPTEPYPMELEGGM
jgi:hypothetical protein